MLQTMRSFTQSFVVKILFVLLALSFVLWGIGDVFRNMVLSDTSVASLGGEKITDVEYQTIYHNMSRREGQGVELTPEQARKKGLPDRALQSAIDSAAVDYEVKRLGLTVGDAQIFNAVRSAPAFMGVLGTFDRQKFLQWLQQQGTNEPAFIEEMRGNATRGQVMNAASDGLTLPAPLTHAIFDYLNERRAVDYVVVPVSAAGEIPDPSDAQLQAFIKAHQSEFNSPEYRSLTYAAIAPQDVIDKIAPTDQQLKNQYEINKADPAKGYVVPETREVEQLNFPNAAAAKAARAKIDTGASFTDLAKSLNQPPVPLGQVTKESLGDRGATVFSTQAGGVTQPVKNLAGFALFHVTKITPGVNKSFAEVKDALAKEAKQQLAEAKMDEYNKAYNDAIDTGLDLAGAAKRAGMRVVRVPAVDANGMAPDGSKANIPDDPSFQAILFKTEVGDEGDTFSGKNHEVYVVKVESDTPSKPKPFADVRAQAASMWLADAQQKALAAKAKSLTDEANRAGNLNGVETALNAKKQASPALSRDAGSGDLSLEIVSNIFSVPGGKTVYGPSATGGNYIVARVTGVAHPPAPLGNPNYQTFVDRVAESAAFDIAAGIPAAIRDKQGVTINQQNVDRIAGGGEGS
jgi:peptidyl-prolyl cis-trans isomerase D